MSTKIFFKTLVLSAIFLSQITGRCFADAQSQFYMAEQYYDQKEYANAEQAYQTVLDNWPDYEFAIWAQAGIVTSQLRLANISSDNFENADNAVEKLITDFAQNPELATAVFTAADEYRKIARLDKANPIYQYVVNNFSEIEQPTRSQLLAVIMANICLYETDAAQAAIETMIVRFYEDEQIGGAVYQIAEQYYSLTDYKKTIESNQLILDNWPDSEFAIWAQEGQVLCNIWMEELAAAQNTLDKLLTKFNDHPSLPEALYAIADRFDESGKYEQAASIYQQIIQQYPDSSYAGKANLKLSRVELWPYIQANDDSNTIAATDKLIADFSGNPDLPEEIFRAGEDSYFKALKYKKQGQDNQAMEYFHDAVDMWERIIQEPLVTVAALNAYYYSARSYYQLGEYEKAIDYCQNLITNWPHYEHVDFAQCIIGRSYEQLKDSGAMTESEAKPLIEEAYKLVLEKYPDGKSVKEASERLGWLNFRRGQWTQTIEYWQLTMQKCPPNYRPYYLMYPLGKAYTESGQPDKAIRIYEEFINAIDPNDPRIAKVRVEIEKLNATQ